MLALHCLVLLRGAPMIGPLPFVTSHATVPPYQSFLICSMWIGLSCGQFFLAIRAGVLTSNGGLTSSVHP